VVRDAGLDLEAELLQVVRDQRRGFLFTIRELGVLVKWWRISVTAGATFAVSCSMRLAGAWADSIALVTKTAGRLTTSVRTFMVGISLPQLRPRMKATDEHG
jgi:hypothetical protein